MSKHKYEAFDLYDFIMVESSIECSNCKKDNTVVLGDSAEDYFFDEGWRATKDNCYCPECAKKKLKLK